jgi:hypothetical protein
LLGLELYIIYVFIARICTNSQYQGLRIGVPLDLLFDTSKELSMTADKLIWKNSTGDGSLGKFASLRMPRFAAQVVAIHALKRDMWVTHATI